MRMKQAFTLIELLVVIAIIAMLLAIMVPALQSARELATGIVCMANQKGLSLAWTLYAEDNDSYIVGGSTYGGTKYRWCERPLFNDTDNPFPPSGTGSSYPTRAEFNEEYRMNGIRAGSLFKYTENEKLYHCPNDRAFVTEEDDFAVYRTYAITGQMNSEDSRSNTIAIPSGGSVRLGLVTKYNQISTPANKYVFVEEDVVNSPVHGKQDHNLGGFVLMGGSNFWQWWDIPAYYHNDMSTLGFADGHAEKHKWRDTRTIDLMKHQRGAPNQPSNVQPDNDDMFYMNKGYVAIRQ